MCFDAELEIGRIISVICLDKNALKKVRSAVLRLCAMPGGREFCNDFRDDDFVEPEREQAEEIVAHAVEFLAEADRLWTKIKQTDSP